MPAIFLSYRRADTAGYAGRLAEALERRFGKGSVFQDVEAIVPGSDFLHAIDLAVARCQVLLVLIGDTWLTERGAGGCTRLDDPADFVRLEVASALRAQTPVLPVLLEGTKMPAENALPAELKPLARLQALELSDTRWDYDLERLVSAIRRVTGGRRSPDRRRALRLAGATIAIAAVAAVAAYAVLSQPAELSGRWYLPDGSIWIVVQAGSRLDIEEIHYESKQVWKRGRGTVRKDRVEFALDLVYGGPRRYEGRLELLPDGTTLTGEIGDPQRGRTESLTLTRDREVIRVLTQ